MGYNGVEDSDIIQLANEIKSLYTKDGNVIIANILFSLNSEYTPVIFPKTINDVGNSVFGEMYYLMSSHLPMFYNQQIKNFDGLNDSESFHTALAFNTNINDVPKLLQSLIYNQNKDE